MRSRTSPSAPGRVETARIACRAAASSRLRFSASGVRAGEKSRPLNAVTVSPPARQPAWASRVVARRPSHRPTLSGISAASRSVCTL